MATSQKQKSTVTKKRAMAIAMKKTLGNVTQSCKMVDVERTTYYSWVKRDPKFAEEMENVKEMTYDFVESKIMKQIQAGNTTMLIFFAKTKMKDRGYVERRELTMTDQPAFVIKPEQKAAVKMLDVIHKKTGTEDEK